MKNGRSLLCIRRLYFKITITFYLYSNSFSFIANINIAFRKKNNPTSCLINFNNFEEFPTLNHNPSLPND